MDWTTECFPSLQSFAFEGYKPRVALRLISTHFLKTKTTNHTISTRLLGWKSKFLFGDIKDFLHLLKIFSAPKKLDVATSTDEFPLNNLDLLSDVKLTSASKANQLFDFWYRIYILRKNILTWLLINRKTNVHLA